MIKITMELYLNANVSDYDIDKPNPTLFDVAELMNRDFEADTAMNAVVTAENILDGGVFDRITMKAQVV